MTTLIVDRENSNGVTKHATLRTHFRHRRFVHVFDKATDIVRDNVETLSTRTTGFYNLYSMSQKTGHEFSSRIARMKQHFRNAWCSYVSISNVLLSGGYRISVRELTQLFVRNDKTFNPEKGSIEQQCRDLPIKAVER